MFVPVPCNNKAGKAVEVSGSTVNSRYSHRNSISNLESPNILLVVSIFHTLSICAIVLVSQNTSFKVLL